MILIKLSNRLNVHKLNQLSKIKRKNKFTFATLYLCNTDVHISVLHLHLIF